MSKITATFVFPCIQKGYIKDALVSLYKQTPIEFRVVVLDQTRNGFYSDPELWHDISPMIDLYLRSRRNYGFSKGMNEQIIHGLEWGSDYVVACNDDVVFLDNRWFSGVLEQFKRYPEMMAVNPASPIEPGWGYGIGVPGHECPPWGVVIDGDIYPKDLDGTPITFEVATAPGGYDKLLNHRQGHIEGFAGWCVVFPREVLEKVGLYDERFMVGGGEDYDYVQRIYLAGGRASATLGSFVWHWWGKSKDIVSTSKEPMESLRAPFQHTDNLYEYSPRGANSPIYPPRDEHLFGNKRIRKSNGIFIDDPR